MVSNLQHAVAADLIVGRRPVFDARLDVYGYRLGPGGEGPDDGRVTAATVDRHRDGPGWARLWGRRQAFVRPSRAFLTGDGDLPLEPESTVLEVHADDSSDPEVVDGCARLVDAGYRLAVLGLDRADATSPLLDLASFAPLDFINLPTFGLRALMDRAAGAGLRALATGVDDEARLTMARHAGFELFEGSLLSRPLSARPDALTPNRMTVLRMINTVNDPDTSATDLQEVVEADAGLSFRLLHVSSLGADGGLRRPVRSVRQATVLLGREWMYRWLVLVMVADANQGAPEQITITMVRARMAELVATRTGLAPADAAFTVGLVSAMDLVLRAPLGEIVTKLAITDDLVRALLERRGPLGDVLDDVLAWESGRVPARPRSGLDHVQLESCFVEAVGWAEGLQEMCEPVEAPAG